MGFQGHQEADSGVKSKKVQVYCVKMPKNGYAYTVIANAPCGFKVTYLDEKQSRAKAIGDRGAEIGIVSFMDTWFISKFEKEQFLKW